MALPRKCLAAAVAGVMLLQLLAVPAAATSSRKLLQWDSAWWGNSWGTAWGPYSRYPNPSDPVGSGCYHPETYTRYKSGQTAYCRNGGSIYCNWGKWSGSCSGNWVNKKL